MGVLMHNLLNLMIFDDSLIDTPEFKHVIPNSLSSLMYLDMFTNA